MENLNLATLTKKERKAYFKEERKHQELESYKKSQIKKWLVIFSIVIAGILGSWLLVKELTKPIPGKYVADLGRNHVPQEKWEKYTYNSNPPTSGSHDPVWTKAGIYDSPQGDGHLIHSLEHGYVVISYSCMKLSEKLKVQSSKLTGEEETKECAELKKNLSGLAEEKRIWKLIVAPRPNMDSVVAQTAWTYIDTLDSFDKDRIVRFIDAHRDHGPEKTME